MRMKTIFPFVVTLAISCGSRHAAECRNRQRSGRERRGAGEGRRRRRRRRTAEAAVALKVAMQRPTRPTPTPGIRPTRKRQQATDAKNLAGEPGVRVEASRKSAAAIKA